jgi:Tyrosine phosphatase family
MVPHVQNLRRHWGILLQVGWIFLLSGCSIPVSAFAFQSIQVSQTLPRSTHIIRIGQTTSSSSSEETAVVPTEAPQRTTINTPDAETEQLFLQRCRELCQERNLPFQKIKNARDLASVCNSPVRSGRIFRMGRVSDATDPDDIAVLFDELNLQTLVDLRSPTELKDDPTLMRQEVFGNFTNIVWQERRSRRNDCLRVLAPGEGPVQYKNDKGGIKPFWQKQKASIESNIVIATYDNEEEDDNVVLVDAEEECGLEDCLDAVPSVPARPRERYFVSLMNEFKYVKGTVSKLRKRDITATIIKSPGAVFSRRVRSHIKEPFLKEINDGGLLMLNELLLKFGAPGIRYVLQLCADRSRHPIAFYCTAGKDRTGALAAIILSLCGTPVDAIVEDYTLSANVYAEMNDHQAMVGALSQRNLDPKTFLGAPAHVMRQTIQWLEQEYGSVADYCTAIGFSPEQQEQLRRACMEE